MRWALIVFIFALVIGGIFMIAYNFLTSGEDTWVERTISSLKWLTANEEYAIGEDNSTIYYRVCAENEFGRSCSNIVSAESFSQLDNIKIINGTKQWTITKYTGTEADNFYVWIANAKDKKTEIGFILKDGINPADVDLTSKTLYGDAGVILDDKNKPIEMKYESAKCDGKNCYHVSLTSAQAVNVDDYIKLGNNTIILEYQDVKLINYQTDWLDLNVTLYKNINGDWNNTVNNVWVFQGLKKFGANDSSGVEDGFYKYDIVANSGIKKGSDFVYYASRESPASCGNIPCKTIETHEIDFYDICNIKTYYNESLEEEILLFNPQCNFNYINPNNLQVTFYAEYNATLGIISIDPVINAGQVNQTESILNNITTEDYPLSHIKTNDSSLVLYMPFDINLTGSNNVTYDYSQWGNDGVTSHPVWNSSGIHGGSISFVGNGRKISAGSADALDNLEVTGMTLLIWINPVDFGESDIARLFDKTSTTTPSQGWLLRMDNSNFNNGISFLADTDATNLGARSNPGVITINTWQHVAMTWNGTIASNALSFYINAIDATNTTYSSGDGNYVGENAQPLTIGNHKLGTRSYRGSFDEVMIFNRTLSASEISAIYNNQSYRFITPATQLFHNISLSQDGTLNMINVTTNTTYPTGTNISVRALEWNAAGALTTTSAYQPITAGENKITNLSVATTTYNVSLDFQFTPDSYNMFSPILRDNLIVNSFTIEGGAPSDTEYPQFSNYWDNNASLVDSGTAYFNTTITSTNGTATLQFNGVNYTASNTTATDFNISISVASSGTFAYIWNSWGNGTSHNYNNSGVRYYTVNATPASDSEYPQFSNFQEVPANNTAYALNAIYRFNSTITSTNGTVGLEFNGVNYTTSNLSATIFNASVSNLNAGTFSYYYWGYGNGTDKLYNKTTLRYYTVSKATQSFTPLLNGLNQDLTIGYPQQINASYSGNNATAVTISINGTSVLAGINYTWGVGGYLVNYSAPQNQNYSGVEYQINLTINPTSSSVFLYLNHSRASINITAGEAIAINATRETGEGIITILRDGSVINSGSSPLYNLTNFSSAGYFNITANYPATQNYSASSETWFVNATAGAGADITNPNVTSLTEVPSEPVTWQFNGFYRFNATITDNIGVGTVILIFNGQNYTASNLTANIYNVTINKMFANASGHQYSWWVNDTSGNVNNSATGSYNITRAEPLGFSSIATAPSATVTYPTETTTTGSETMSGDGDVVWKLHLGHTEVTNPYITTHGVEGSIYTYRYNTTGGQNWTNWLVTATVTVNQNTTGNMTLWLNNSQGNVTITNGSSIWLNASLNLAGQTIKLYNDGNLINQGTTPIQNLTIFNTRTGEFNITAIFDGDANYSRAVKTWWVNVTLPEAIPDTTKPYFTTIPTDYTMNYTNNFGVDFDATDETAFDNFAINWTDSFSINSTGFLKNTTMLAAGIYKINVTINDSSNNINSTIYSLTINRKTSICSINSNSPQEYPNPINVSGSCDNPENNTMLYRDNIMVTSELGINKVLGVGTYTYVMNTSQSQNYTNASISTSATVNINNSLVLGISGTTPITYGTTTNVAGSGCPSELTCALDKGNAVYGAGTETFNYSTSGNGNYSATSITKDIVINKAAGLVYSYINGSRANKNYNNGTTLNISGSLQTGNGNINLYVNDSLWNTGASQLSNVSVFNTAGTYKINATYAGNQNYTYDDEVWTLTISLTSAPSNATTTVTATPICRYKKLGYWNPKLVWIKQEGCL